MNSPEAILDGLDAEQRQAATALHGPVCILAGAGTGKTRAITHRIAYGVASGVFDPYKTLALTFTARAAAEMRSRLRDLGAHGVQARTFHAAALRQLQYFWPQAIGGPMHRLVEHKVQLIIEAARRLRLSTDKAVVRDLAGEIEWAKVSMLTPQTYTEAAQKQDRELPSGWDIRAVSRLFQAYEDIKTDRQLIDFEDVLLIMVAILEQEPKIAATIRQQYRTFIVDEYQDVSPLQQRLLDGWLGGRDNICVVGDSSQTIYSFTGATSRFLLDFRQKYPHAEQVKLIRDYRSTPEIVELANKVLAERTAKQTASMPRWPEPLELVSQKDSGPTPEFAQCSDDEAEAAWVADRIEKDLARGTPAAEIAVLFRTNGQSMIFEQELNRRNISYVVRGSERFFSRPEIRDGILQLRASARAEQQVHGAEVVDRVKGVLASLGYTAEAPQVAGAQREKWESLNALVNLAQDLVDTRGNELTLAGLVAELDDRASYEHAPTVDGVTLASLHSAKGLEWETVFLVGLTEGLMPISFAEEQADIDEERRLLYVGITRAKTRLHFSWATARNPGGRNSRRPSRFLDSIRPDAVRIGAGRKAQGGTRGRKKYRVTYCLSCEAPLESAAERKVGRCINCPPDYDEQLFERLRDWRSQTAEEAKVPAFVVFTDATLVAIAERLPGDAKQLRALPGIGPAKLEKYGDQVLGIIASHTS